ncbi:hypothetical protein [Brumimicrobium oceani]|uniref:hypothetical protein n=1 Tax=Brumimicrobium oceani TaxID=2100725 RepID=UPI001304DDF8|nr:hypothetical protein [Brumimicrobium oceani]
MKKGIFHIIFIAVTTVILLLINQFGNAESYMAFSLIPILIAYYIGQYSERKFRTPAKD